MLSGFRSVELITMKRKHIHLAGDEKFGHWWFEIGDAIDSGSESYGWWPEHPVGLAAAIHGVPGELNGQTSFRGTLTRDPHHGDEAEEEFQPLVAASDPRTDDQIADCLRGFARSYAGEWRWAFGYGQNCHSFQGQAMRHCGLRKRAPKGWF